MMQHDPAWLEVFLTKLAFRICGKPVYKTFADRLPLDGYERVLDFGCGMGTVAYYAAKRLTNGHLTCLDISERWLNACRRNLRSYGNISFLRTEPELLPWDNFDVAYCHFVLHDISASSLEKVIPALAKSLTSGGAFVFREPLDEREKIRMLKHLMEQSGLSLTDSHIIDVPLMGNALESIYVK